MKTVKANKAMAGKYQKVLLATTLIIVCTTFASAQGGPPYYTNDPGTPPA